MRKIRLFLALLAAAILISGPVLLFARGGGRGGRGGEQGGREERGGSEGPGEEGDRGGPDGMGEEGPDRERPDGEERGGGRGGRGGRGDRGEEGPDQMGEEGPEGEGPEGGGRGKEGEGPADEAERPDFETCMQQAGELIAQKEYKGAAEEYNKALMGLSGEDGRKVYVYERLGWVAVKEKDYDGALGFYQTAIYQAEKLDMSDRTTVNAYRGAAYCQEKDGDLEGAAENYEKALKLTKSKMVRNDIKKKLALLKARLKKKAAGQKSVEPAKPPAGPPVKPPAGPPVKPPAKKVKK